MAVFKKLKKGKDKGVPLPEPEPVKQLDKRVGMDTYRFVNFSGFLISVQYDFKMEFIAIESHLSEIVALGIFSR